MKWANLTGGPLILPNSRRGYTTFRPGECTSDAWFSKFVSKTMLTPVPDDWIASNVIKPVKAPAVFTAQPFVPVHTRKECLSSCQTSCQVTCELSCESSDQPVVVLPHGEKIGSTFHCRYCEWTTQDDRKIGKHVESYHAQQLSNIEEKQEKEPEKAEEIRQESEKVESGDLYTRKDGVYICNACSKIGFSWSTPYLDSMERHCSAYHSSPERQEENNSVDNIPANKKDTNVFACPECGKVCKDNRGLSAHMRVHNR